MKNFDLRKYLKENKLIKETINIDGDGEDFELSGESGTYDGWDDNGKVSFSVVYEDEEDSPFDYTEDDIQDFLGNDHAFIELANKIPAEWNIGDDFVEITVNTEDLKKLLNK